MGFLDEPLTDIKNNAIEQWDYASVFPSGEYTFPRGPIFVNGWPWQLLEGQLESMINGQMTQPVIAIHTIVTSEEHKSFSDIYQTGGTGPRLQRLGVRARPSFLISCWADQQLGGMDFARKLAGQVQGAILYYRNRLTTIRHLETLHSHEAFDDGPQLYHVDLTVEGDIHITIDV